jgi:hypothetical protein
MVSDTRLVQREKSGFAVTFSPAATSATLQQPLRYVLGTVLNQDNRR